MALVDDLLAALPEGAVVTDPDVLETYRRDQAALVPAGRPAAAVLPTSTEQVRETVRLARRYGVPVVPRGAGTGLSGGANAVDGAIVLVLRKMDRIVAIDPASLTVRVQPGLLNSDLKRAAAAHGLWYPPDPASQDISSIGGNVATNAGGLCCVKYGVTRDAVLGLEVVLADGSVARVGRNTFKGVVGYDLVGLFVGSEGTLGIVTEVTLRLRPQRAAPTTLVALFDDLPSLGAAITAITRTNVPALLEVMDRTTIQAVERWKRMGLDTEAAGLLVAQSDAPGAQGDAEAASMREHCDRAGAAFVAVSTDPAEAELLLAARRFAYPALERQGAALLDDVAVPVGHIPRLLAAIQSVAEATSVTVGTFGHAGDGNMHPTIVFDPGDEADAAAARDAFDAILRAALDLGGTVSGEHGVGLLKAGYVDRELDEGAVRLHRTIKDALDPQGLLNPGKVLRAPR